VIARDLTGRREHVDLLKALADTLSEEHQVSYAIENIEEAIAIYEEVLQLRPSNHPQRTEALCDLGGTLERFCVHHGEDRPWARGQRCIQLLRKSLELRSPGHPLRAESLQVLAKALFTVQHSEDTSGNLQLVTESVNLNRDIRKPAPLWNALCCTKGACPSQLQRGTIACPSRENTGTAEQTVSPRPQSTLVCLLQSLPVVSQSMCFNGCIHI
jgi:hypothetical protein